MPNRFTHSKRRKYGNPYSQSKSRRPEKYMRYCRLPPTRYVKHYFDEYETFIISDNREKVCRYYHLIYICLIMLCYKEAEITRQSITRTNPNRSVKCLSTFLCTSSNSLNMPTTKLNKYCGTTNFFLSIIKLKTSNP